MSKFNLNTWLKILVVAGSGVIYSIPYIMWTFYVPLFDAMGVDNAQFGLIMTVYSLANLPMYVFGGYFADRFNPTKLIIIGLLGTGALGFIYATLPAFSFVLVIQFFLAIFGTGLHWQSMLKATRIISDEIGQGFGFGGLEALRKLTTVGFNALGVGAFAFYGEGRSGLQAALAVFSGLCILMAILTYFTFKGINYNKTAASDKVNIKMFFPLLMKPIAWLIGLIVFCIYLVSATQGYITAYLVEVFEMSEAQSAWFVTFGQFIAPFVVILGGWLSDKAGTGKGLLIAQIALAVTIVIILLVPANVSYLVPVMISLLIFLSVLFTVRGIYWALVKFSGIPTFLSGTAIGVISIIGYSPDFFIYTLAGSWLDAYGLGGYTRIFSLMLGVTIVSVFITILLLNYLKKHTAEEMFGSLANNKKEALSNS